MSLRSCLIFAVLLTWTTVGFARQPIGIKGVFPNITISSGYKDRSEAGIGALVPWADKPSSILKLKID